MSLIKKSLAFSSATFVSRITGLLRDISLAVVYGAGKVLDSYFVSIIFPFFFRKIFGEGALASSFVPHYRSVENKDEFVSSVLNVLGITTMAIVLLIELYPGIVPMLFAPGYPQEVTAEVKKLVRISVLLVPLMFFWATFYSVLNSHKKFFFPALTPLFMNIGVIAGTLLGKGTLWSVTGFVIGGAVSTVMLGHEALKYFEYRFVFKGFGGFLPDFLKATASVMTNQLNLLVDTLVASFLEFGAVSSIQLASRLYQFPVGLFVVAVSTVSLVEMTEREARKDASSAALFLSLPSAIGLFVLSDGVVNLLYSFGNFSSQATFLTSRVLKMYSLGIVFYSLYLVSLRYHHSAKRMNIPFVSSLLVSGINIILDFPLGFSLGAPGVALATSISSMAGVAFFGIRKEIKLDWCEFTKVSISSAVMGFVAWFIGRSGGKLETALAISVALGVYFTMMKLLKSRVLDEVISRRKH